jgi:hypothetical protein
MWAEQNGDYWNYTSNRMKMAAELGKERGWQDDPLCRLERRVPCTSSTILVPGYNTNNFPADGSHKLAKNLNSISEYQDQQGGIILLLYFQKLDLTHP